MLIINFNCGRSLYGTMYGNAVIRIKTDPGYTAALYLLIP